MKQLKLKKQIEDIIFSYIHNEYEYSNCKHFHKAIIKAINKRVKNIDIGEIFKNFIWSDDKKDVSDLIIYIKESIIREMK